MGYLGVCMHKHTFVCPVRGRVNAVLCWPCWFSVSCAGVIPSSVVFGSSLGFPAVWRLFLQGFPPTPVVEKITWFNWSPSEACIFCLTGALPFNSLSISASLSSVLSKRARKLPRIKQRDLIFFPLVRFSYQDKTGSTFVFVVISQLYL